VIIDDAGVGMDAHSTERAAALLSGRHSVDVTRLDDPPQFGFAVIGVLAARYGFSVSADTRSPYGGVRAVVFLPSALLTHRDPAEELPPVTTPPARASARTPSAPARETGGGHPSASPSVSASPAADTAASARTSGGSVGAADEPVATDAEGTTATTVGGLPKRRRRAQRPAEPASDAQAASASASASTSTSTSASTPVSTSASAPVEEPVTRSAEESARRMGAFARGTLHGRADQDTDTTPHEDEGNIQG